MILSGKFISCRIRSRDFANSGQTGKSEVADKLNVPKAVGGVIGEGEMAV